MVFTFPFKVEDLGLTSCSRTSRPALFLMGHRTIPPRFSLVTMIVDIGGPSLRFRWCNQLKLRRRRWLMLAQGSNEVRPLGDDRRKNHRNPERVPCAANPFRVQASSFYKLSPGLSLRSNSGLKLANAFGVLRPTHYCEIQIHD